MTLPTGEVSLLFTDVEGSTRLLTTLGVGFDAVMAAQRDILRSAVEAHAGTVFGTEGDAVFAVFEDPNGAVGAAGDAQRRLAAHTWPDGAEVRVRMAVHTGEVRRVGDDYYGMCLHVAARVCSAGHGGQVLLTGATCAALTGCQVRELGEHRFKDLPEPLAVLQLLGDGLTESFPQLRSLSSIPHNLPAGTDEFIGRTDELAQVAAGLTTHRLVTLTGAGGSGKTRLSVEAATRTLGSVRDGVWFIELAPVSEAPLIASQIAMTLGLGETSGTPLEDTLIEWLRGREVLLVLDNCEHLVDGVADLVDRVLRACPSVLVLASSRELLGVRGELALRVPPLGFEGEAASLFLARAETMVPGFDRDAIDRGVVDQVCRRLDGLPLAIELAAARLRSLSVRELDARLDDRFRLLTGGGRTAPDRHRTLAAVVDWSYELLAEPERALFRTVCAFPDAFTRSAAAALTGGDELEVLDGLGRLVEKSLLVPSEVRSGTDRFQLLETLRQYGRERQRQNGEEDACRDALLAWAMTLVERLERDMRTPRMDAALAAVMPERVSMRAAMERAIERDDLSSALRLVTAVPLGLTSERRELIVDLLARGGDRLAADVVARAHLTLSDLAFEQGDWAAASEAAAVARSGFVELGDLQHAAWAGHNYCSGCWGSGDLDELDDALAENMSEFRAVDDDYGIALSLWFAALREPDRATAIALAQESERRYRELGSPMMRAHALEAHGLIELEGGDVEAAGPLLREAVRILAAAGNQGCTAHTLEVVAVLVADRGDVNSAGELVGAADALRAASGAGHKPWEVRARHGGHYDANVLGGTEAIRLAVVRGRQNSLSSVAALADALLASAADAGAETTGAATDVEARTAWSRLLA